MCFSCLPILTAVTTAARLMGCGVSDLVLALSTRKIVAGKDSIPKKLTLQQVGLDLINTLVFKFISYC